MGKYIFSLLLVCLFAESASSGPCSSSVSSPDFRPFLYDLISQCPVSETPFYSSPLLVDGESFEKAISTGQKNGYTAILFYASWCPFSSMFLSKFSTLSAMYPQVKHLMVEQSSAMPSVFSRYGIHSVPALVVVNQTTRVRYHGRKDLHALINFYKRTTGQYPVMDFAEETETSKDFGSALKAFKLWHGASVKEMFSKEPCLLYSVIFVFLRIFLYLFPEIASHITALWAAYIPRLNLAIFGESRQLLGHVLHLIDVKRIWSKLKLSQTRKFQNAGVWASSLSSMSLGKTPSSSRALLSRDSS